MLKSLEINRYKGFNDFKIDNLSQLNIISGKNNIGKTVLLEAIFLSKINRITIFRQQIIPIFEARDLSITSINLFLKDINIEFKVNGDKKTIQYKSREELTSKQLKTVDEKYDKYDDFLVMRVNQKDTIMPFENNPQYSKECKNIFIDSSKPMNIHLVKLYSNIQDLGKQDEFLKYLQTIDKDITDIEPQTILSAELGEGTNRFIEILSILLINPNSTVVIDRLEKGIHSKKLYNIWKVIIEIIQKENIQLFLTTHNLESIEALNDASKDMQFNKISSITLTKDEDNIIYPIVRQYSSFTASIDSGMEIRQ